MEDADEETDAPDAEWEGRPFFMAEKTELWELEPPKRE